MHIIENGNVAAAIGVRLCRANVIAAYPITPQTPLTEKLSEYVEAGEMKAEYIPVESEHSAMAVCIAASSAGARAFTATSANGLLYMHEQIQWAAGARLPIVMCLVNRAVGAPWNIWNDQQDSISQRDTGWIQMYCADHQQIIDSVIKAFRLAEKVSIPVMVCYDGYILSHTYMPFDVPDERQVDEYLPPFQPEYALRPEDPANLNTVTLPDVRKDVHGEMAHGYMEIRYLLQEDMRKALNVAAEVEKSFAEIFGRGGNPYLEDYRCDDADFVAVGLGSLTYQLRVSVDTLRKEGIKAGVLGLRYYRPFPDEAIFNALKGKKKVIVFEKALSYGYEGALASDVKSALYEYLAATGNLPVVQNFITGIGGREIRTEDLTKYFRAATQSRVSKEPFWIGLKL
ncbi:MAG: pyruvate ferredoxin oxidoreductase [Syntrophaceae bacterium]|jgi:pyruvate/2-oxoacid:ferredoxin oxidoreductase alpha subunit|nr:pyruvate ferredoxin oxidoreductase [Syntrophaceae bacterium]